ncbi:MAG: 16S rRNA (uracil(1498)-N(3))-methyltransferase [Armatimonadetes bacterium]|nr:16S rRNA (uracil(1498)-N(3))-methyltransferase [Candidatus Hippobium faecium]
MKNQYRFFCPSDFDELKHQIYNVLRLRNGSLFSLVIKGREYLCRLTAEGYDVIEDITEDREPKKNVTLAVAGLKKDKLEYVFQKCTETGVNGFLIFNGDNSVKNTDRESFGKLLPRYEKIVTEACEQSYRLIKPCIDFTALEKIDLSTYDRIFLTDESGLPLREVLDDRSEKILLFIGPEGGFSDRETDYILSCGGEKISFGKRIMRSETSAVAISASIISFYE